MTLRDRFEFLGLLVGVVGGLCGLAGMVGAFYLLPYRVSAVERQVVDLARQRDTDNELLTRIEERLIQVQTQLKEGRTR